MKEITAIFITILITASSPGRVITVDDDNPADFTTIQAAINDANDGDIVEIQPGTYTGDGNRDVDFLGKAITVTSTDPNDPNTVATTIITGDAFIFQSGEDADSVIDGLAFTDGEISITDGGPTIMNCTFTGNRIRISDSDPIIANCTFANSNLPIYCEPNGSLTISNCLFYENYSSSEGGAIYINQSQATLANCVFRGNYVGSSGWDGAGIHCIESSLTLTNCLFHDNYAPAAGGAISARDCELALTDCLFSGCEAPVGAAVYCRPRNNPSYNVSITNCQFIGNRSIHYTWTRPNYEYGGAVSVGGGNLLLANCLFTGNLAPSFRAGALFVSSSNVGIKNCTFADNLGSDGNSLVIWDGRYTPSSSDIHIENSIMWDGPESLVIKDETALLVTFSDIPGAVPGYGNIYADPCFVDPGHWVDSRDPNIVVDPNHDYASWVNGDYHVKSQGGRYDPSMQTWVEDDVTSLCIDAGAPNSSLGPEPFPNGGRRNIGVYGGTAEASKSYFGKPLCETIVAGDINGDCIVNGLDFSLMGTHWLGGYRKAYPAPAADPYPADGESSTSTHPNLSWDAGSGAASHDVYFGSEAAAMRYADRDSPEYKGNQTDRTFDPGPLLRETTYYWRIDEIGPNGETTIGGMWAFTTTSSIR